MTSEIGSIITEVDAAVGSADAKRRGEILRQITDLFASEASRLKVDQIAAFDAVIIRLAHGIDSDARAELSERLADCANAPPMVVRDLAFDASAKVAGPLLTGSLRLSDDDLLHLAERRGPGHLLALARRSAIPKPLADLLIQRGDRDVARSLAGNDSVFFSERAYAILMRRAVSDPVLVADLVKRSDVSPAHRKRLTALADEQAEHMLDEAFGAGAQEALIAAGADR